MENQLGEPTNNETTPTPSVGEKRSEQIPSEEGSEEASEQDSSNRSASSQHMRSTSLSTDGLQQQLPQQQGALNEGLNVPLMRQLPSHPAAVANLSDQSLDHPSATPAATSAPGAGTGAHVPLPPRSAPSHNARGQHLLQQHSRSTRAEAAEEPTPSGPTIPTVSDSGTGHPPQGRPSTAGRPVLTPPPSRGMDSLNTTKSILTLGSQTTGPDDSGSSGSRTGSFGDGTDDVRSLCVGSGGVRSDKETSSSGRSDSSTIVEHFRTPDANLDTGAVPGLPLPARLASASATEDELEEDALKPPVGGVMSAAELLSVPIAVRPAGTTAGSNVASSPTSAGGDATFSVRSQEGSSSAAILSSLGAQSVIVTPTSPHGQNYPEGQGGRTPSSQ